MKRLIFIIVLFLSHNLSAKSLPNYCYVIKDNIQTIDLTLQGCEYPVNEADAVVSVSLSPNAITGMFGIKFLENIEDYKVHIKNTDSIEWYEWLINDGKKRWINIVPLKKNINFTHYLINTPPSDKINTITQIAAAGEMKNKNLCVKTIDKIRESFFTKHFKFYKAEEEIKDLAYRKILFLPKKNTYQMGFYFPIIELKLSCHNQAISIRLKNLTLEKYLMNGLRIIELNNINVENIVN